MVTNGYSSELCRDVLFRILNLSCLDQEQYMRGVIFLEFLLTLQKETISSLDKGKQKTNNIIGCQPYTKHRFQQNRSGVFVCVLDIVTRSAPARFHRSVHGVSAGFTISGVSLRLSPPSSPMNSSNTSTLSMWVRGTKYICPVMLSLVASSPRK